MSSVVNELLAVAREGFEPTRPFGPMLLRHRCLASSSTWPKIVSPLGFEPPKPKGAGFNTDKRIELLIVTKFSITVIE